MGIVVSSRQASNIFWHSVTRLNAICVLISSLQPPRPLEERGVGWFPLFHSLLCLWLSLSSFLNVTTYHFFSPLVPLLVLLLFFVSLSPSVVSTSVQGGFLSPDSGSIYLFCALVCHLVSKHRQICSQTDRATTCSSILFCPSASRPRCTTCQPAVFLREKKSKWTARKISTNKTAGSCHFFSLLISPVPPPLLFSELGSTEHPVFIWVRNHLSCIWHLDKVDGQRAEMRADDGERQLTVSGDPHYSSLFSPLIPSLYCILIGWLMYHGNSLWV